MFKSFDSTTPAPAAPASPQTPSTRQAPVRPVLVDAAPIPAGHVAADDRAAGITQSEQEREILDLKHRLHEVILEGINLAAIEKVDRSELRREISALTHLTLQQENRQLGSDKFNQLISQMMDEVLGLGPLEPLLADDTVSDILVNGHEKVFVERHGMLERTPVRFRNERHLLRIIDKIVSGVGRRIDESSPWVDARLEDGSRVNAIIRPSAIDGPSLSIRKFTRDKLTIEKLVGYGALSHQAGIFLEAAAKARMNVLISGGTGSGKTTMLNALSGFIDGRQRIVTIEDAAELQLQQDHVVRLETRPPNMEGSGSISQRDLVRNALRMRPDRIVIGEVRGVEAFDMLQAMNTGHDGSMTTIHANTARDAIGRLEQMVVMVGNDFPMSAVRSQIASGIQIVLQLNRLSDGSRRVMSISEITGMESGTVLMQDIFKFERSGLDADGKIVGRFAATGVRPKCAAQIKSAGFDLPVNTFTATED